MNHLLKPFAWMLVLCVLLTGCGQSSSEVSSSADVRSVAPSEPTQTATLYTDLSAGTTDVRGLTEEHEFQYSGTLTAETLAQGLSELTGLDFFITATENVDGIVIDWAEDSTLIANLDDREQKEAFSFFDVDSLRWFMLDSMWRTLIENLDVENIYYTMKGGEDLLLEGLSLKDRFSRHSPFMGSAFYRGHADVRGEESDPERGDDLNRAFELVFEALTLHQRREDCPVVVSTGEDVIEGETCWLFSAGSNSADGLKFTAMYSYAVSESEQVYYRDLSTDYEWMPLEGRAEPEMTGEMSSLIISFADAFFGGVQDPPVLHGVVRDALTCTFVAADGEMRAVDFGRDPSIGLDQQMYLLVAREDGQHTYRVLFEDGVYSVEDENGTIMTAEEFAER